MTPETVKHQKLILKWGCDGSSGHSEYKQKFSDPANSDASVFLSSIVPLRLASFDSSTNDEVIVWKNPKPSSPRYCRPIRLQFMRETAESTREEEKYITDQIQSLTSYKTVIDGKEIEISYVLVFSMIDGKVVNSITGTKSTMRCYLCSATSKDFNNIDAMIKREVDVSNLRFGISSLHAWIRFFEFFLHLGYKLGNKKWQARSEEEKLNPH